MSNEERKDLSQGEKPGREAEGLGKWLTPEGRPVKVLSTSLGVALLANALLIPGASSASGGASGEEPKLVSWSTDEVKQYFDKNVDWNIPLPEEARQEEQQPQQGGVSTSNGTTVINHYGGYNSGFGWDDLLLYHFLFNSGSIYSSSRWYDTRPAYYSGTRNVYKPRSYNSGRFQNKSVAGSVVKPRTSTSSTGSITRRSTSSKSGGIGGTSGGLGSSSSKSKSSSSGSISRSGSGKSSGGFGG